MGGQAQRLKVVSMTDNSNASQEGGSNDMRSVIYSTRYANKSRPEYERNVIHYSKIIGRRMQVASDAKCLDVACGDGNFLAFYREMKIANYVGFDNDIAQVNCAIKEFGESYAMLDDAFSFLRRCDRASFNIISALDFVEHLTKLECLHFLSLASNALIPGGMLLVRTPNADSPWGMSTRYNDLTHEICFTPNALRDTVRACGFSSVEFWEDVPMVGEGFSHSLRWAGWRLARLLLLSFAFLEVGRATDRVFSRNMWALAFRSKELAISAF
jgi:2-polyprenyl-3-methyl-5-hydroxy-6-metoxy-1,4-benzoquinol methylase